MWENKINVRGTRERRGAYLASRHELSQSYRARLSELSVLCGAMLGKHGRDSQVVRDLVRALTKLHDKDRRAGKEIDRTRTNLATMRNEEYWKKRG